MFNCKIQLKIVSNVDSVKLKRNFNKAIVLCIFSTDKAVDEEVP